MVIDTEFAFNRYEQIRHRLPVAQFAGRPVWLSGLLELEDDIDVFLFDAFGVLNVGETCIAGAPEVVASLQSMGKKTIVVTNAGTVEKASLLGKYQNLGYRFEADQVVSSREMLGIGLKDYPDWMRWGVAATSWSTIDSIASNLELLGDDPQGYARADGFIFLSSQQWDTDRQRLMIDSLVENPRPVLVGNPDLIAPRENGFSLEPGYYANEVADKTRVAPQFFGKPFANVFQQVKATHSQLEPQRTLMIGDTLHTDILGGSAAGFKTALVTDHGLFKNHDINNYIQRCNIIPDYILPAI